MIRPRLRRSLAGRLCPNAVLDEGGRLDDVAAGRFIVVTAIDPSAAQRSEVAQRGAAVIVARPGSELDRWLHRERAAIVRPDGTVLRAANDLRALVRDLPTFHPAGVRTTRAD